MINGLITTRIQESICAKEALLTNIKLQEIIEQAAECISQTLKTGGKLVLCGNGGSASDALHFAGEIVGRFVKERDPWPAVVLNADVASLTAIANDYGYDDVFAREAKAFLSDKDIFVGISTSGNSENVYRAALVAKNVGAKSIALLGRDGGKIGKAVDLPLIVPHSITARVQECHIMIIHIICELIENIMSGE